MGSPAAGWAGPPAASREGGGAPPGGGGGPPAASRVAPAVPGGRPPGTLVSGPPVSLMRVPGPARPPCPVLGAEPGSSRHAVKPAVTDPIGTDPGETNRAV